MTLTHDIDPATFDPCLVRIRAAANEGTVPFEVPLIGEIAPNLWQGGVLSDFVLPQQIRHVVSLHRHNQWVIRHELASYLVVAMEDGPGQSTSRIDAIARWVNECREDGPVLVHCLVGINRSSVVVARALMLGGMTAADAIALIREKRSPACLCNKTFEDWVLSLDR